MAQRTASFAHMIALLLLAAGSAQGGELPPLEELEAGIDRSSAMRLLDAECDASRQRLELEKGSQGASFYSQTSFSDHSEVIDQDRTRSYRQIAAGAGVRVPLLGSRLRWQQAVSGRELELLRVQSERELRRRELVKQLRSAYASYWGGQRLALLASGYLEREPEANRDLGLRVRAGLLLDRDRLEFLSGFALARRDAAIAELERARAIERIRGLVASDVEQGAVRRPAQQPRCSVALESAAYWAAEHPEVRFLREASVSAERSAQDSALYALSSELRVGYQASKEAPSGETGGSAAITWSVEGPIQFLRQRRLLQASAEAQRSHAKLEYELRRQEIEQEMRQALRQRAVLDRSLEFATTRLAAGDEAVRESQLRVAAIAGDVIEQALRAELGRYNAAKDVVDAELALADWAAAWALYEPSRCLPRALYVWSSQGLLEELAAPGEGRTVAGVRADGVQTLLVALDRAQIEAVRSDPQPLRSALRAAHSRGLQVELLLGEPTWLVPRARADLLAIVRALRELPFDGLHLDIEPEQLADPELSSDARLAALVDTVRDVRAVSPWPVGLSLHPRNLTRAVGERSFGERMVELGASVTLMIYVSNPERVAEIAEPLLAAYPELRQRIALSIEDELGAEESLHSYAPAERARRIESIEARVRAPGFAGIVLQPTRGVLVGNLTGERRP
jgi:outer membrane protein TolC